MIIAYKGFDKDLSCTAGGNRFQYELGTWNEETEATAPGTDSTVQKIP